MVHRDTAVSVSIFNMKISIFLRGPQYINISRLNGADGLFCVLLSVQTSSVACICVHGHEVAVQLL